MRRWPEMSVDRPQLYNNFMYLLSGFVQQANFPNYISQQEQRDEWKTLDCRPCGHDVAGSRTRKDGTGGSVGRSVPRNSDYLNCLGGTKDSIYKEIIKSRELTQHDGT